MSSRYVSSFPPTFLLDGSRSVSALTGFQQATSTSFSLTSSTPRNSAGRTPATSLCATLHKRPSGLWKCSRSCPRQGTSAISKKGRSANWCERHFASLCVVPLPHPDNDTCFGTCELTPMLTPMHAQITRVTHTAHELSVNILYPATLDAHYMLWLTSLTKGSEFHLYYNI